MNDNMKWVFGLVFLSLLLVLNTGTVLAQEPIPPKVPSPTPEPDPLPIPEPEPTPEPFPGQTLEEEIELLKKENKQLKTENKELNQKINELEIYEDFLQEKINELNQEITNLKALALEQMKVIMDLAEQLKNIIFEQISQNLKLV